MKRIGAALVAVAAIAALYFLVLDPSGKQDAGNGDASQGYDDSGAPIEGDDSRTDGGEAASGDEARGPVLFTTGKKRSGKGGLRGQLKWFDSGEPAPQLRVKIAGRGRKGEPIDYTLTSDDRGSFSVADVPASDAIVVLVAAGSEHERTLPSVLVEPDTVTDLRVVWLGQRGLLEGRVTDVEGNPIAGAKVQVHEGFGSMLEAASQMLDFVKTLDRPVESEYEATTKDDGTYAIADVPPGTIVVVAQAGGFETGVEQIIKSARESADRVDFTLAPGVIVRGVVVDTDDRGIGDARVVMIQQRGMLTGFLARSFATTDGLGRFELAVPPGGTGNLGVLVAANRYPSSLFEVRNVNQAQRYELVGGAEMKLRVVEAESGKPLPEADIMAFVGDEAQMSGQPGALVTAVTDETGHAQFYARPGMLQMLWVKHPRVGSQMFAKGMGAMAAGIELEDASIKKGINNRTVKVQVGTRLYGVVKSDKGEPIAGARIRAMGMMGAGVDTLTDEQGRYECVTNSAFMMGLIATAPGWIQDAEMPDREAPAPGAEEVEWDIVMKPAVSVSGRILDPKGKPVAGARVRLGTSGGRFDMARMFTSGSEAVTTTNGRYILDGVAGGTKKARVMARAKGFIDVRSDEFDVAATGTTDAGDLSMRDGLTVDVQITDRSGDGVARAGVEVDTTAIDPVDFDPMGGMMQEDHRTTNAAGKVTLTDLPPGRLTITATGSGFAATRGRLELAADAKEPYKLEITLRDAVPVKGKVVDQDGNPVKGAAVRSQTQYGSNVDEATWVPRVRGSSGRDGTFVLEGLPDVTLTLEVSAKGYGDAKVQVIGANRDSVEALLQKRDAGVQREIEKVEEELQKLYRKFATAKGEAQKELMDEVQRLQTKLQRLKGEQEDDPAPPGSRTSETEGDVIEEAPIKEAPIKDDG